MESGIEQWIYGAQADPKKMKMLRLIMRERSACINAGECTATDTAIANSTRLLLKATEHTFRPGLANTRAALMRNIVVLFV